jgi:hypothetical protein
VLGEPGLGTVPGDELLHRELVVPSRICRAQAIERCVFRMIQIRQTKDDLVAKGLLVLLAHMSGLHTAGMRIRYIRAILAVRVQ